MSAPGHTTDRTASVTPLVDPAWLEAQVTAARDVVVLQVDVDSSTYYEGHLPGSLPLDWYDELHERIRRAPVTLEHFEQLMGRKGITEDTHVVLAGAGAGAYAAHAYWIFKYYRHERVSLLDGGRSAWAEAGLPLEDGEPELPPGTTYRSRGVDHAVRVLRDDLLRRYVGAPPPALVIDCRTPAEYEGRSRSVVDLAVEQDRVGGHIPGASNLPSALLLDEGQRFHDVATLRRLFESRGLRPGSAVVVYCRVAERSSLLWFALHELLGHPSVRHYDGGWAEYGSLIDVPVDRDDLS